MARKADDVDIYIDTYSLTMVLAQTVKNMRKDFKYILGIPCLKLGSDIVLLISKINSSRDKAYRLANE